MAVRIRLVGARAELALMVAGVAAGCGVEVVADECPGGGGGSAELAGAADRGLLWELAGWTGSGPTAGSDPGPGDGCDLVLVDAVGLQRGGGSASAGWSKVSQGGDRRWLVVHLAGESDAAREWAAARQVDHVVELPEGRSWLAGLLAAPAQDRRVLGVVGAVGGAGTTTVALACAAAMAARRSPGGTLMVDADPWSTGVDLPLGIPDGRGARWADLPAGGGTLVADSLRAGLPQVGGISVLTGSPPPASDPRVAAVVRTGRDDFAATILDAGRGPLPPGIDPRDAVVLVTPATLAGVVGAHRLLSELSTSRVLLAVRPTGWLPPAEVAEQVGADRLVVVPSVRALAERIDCGDVLDGRVGRALGRLGEQVWGALA